MSYTYSRRYRLAPTDSSLKSAILHLVPFNVFKLSSIVHILYASLRYLSRHLKILIENIYAYVTSAKLYAFIICEVKHIYYCRAVIQSTACVDSCCIAVNKSVICYYIKSCSIGDNIGIYCNTAYVNLISRCCQRTCGSIICCT